MATRKDRGAYANTQTTIAKYGYVKNVKRRQKNMRHHNSPGLDHKVFRNTANTTKKVNIVRHSMRGGIRF